MGTSRGLLQRVGDRQLFIRVRCVPRLFSLFSSAQIYELLIDKDRYGGDLIRGDSYTLLYNCMLLTEKIYHFILGEIFFRTWKAYKSFPLINGVSVHLSAKRWVFDGALVVVYRRLLR